LLNFKVGNYKSFCDNQFISTIPGKIRSKSSHVVSTLKYKSLKFNAVFGGNASGKSNLVSAIRIMKSSVINGKIRSNINDVSFRLGNQSDKYSKFEVEIAIDNQIFAYGFSADFLNGSVNSEYLYQTDSSKDILIFDYDNRDDSNKNCQVNKKLTTIENYQRVMIYVQDLKKDELLIHKFVNAKVEEHDKFFTIASLVHKWFRETLVIITPSSSLLNIIGQFTESDKNQEVISVIELVRSFDTGITGYKYDTMDVEVFISKLKAEGKDSESNENIASLEEIIHSLKKGHGIDVNFGNNFYQITFDKKKNKPKVELLTFEHCNNNCTTFTFNEESDGTVRLIELVNVLYTSQLSEKVFIIDELERSLHPNLSTEFIRKFIEITENKKSQMIITTHETNIMNLDLLRQDELWVVERNSMGMSLLISLSKYKIRSDKILDRDYLAGRYGGVPNIEKCLCSRGPINGEII